MSQRKELANGTRASYIYDRADQLTCLANLKSDDSVISTFWEEMGEEMGTGTFMTVVWAIQVRLEPLSATPGKSRLSMMARSTCQHIEIRGDLPWEEMGTGTFMTVVWAIQVRLEPLSATPGKSRLSMMARSTCQHIEIRGDLP